MAEWLKKAIDEVDRQFERLPDWRKTAVEHTLKPSSTEEDRSSTIREPRQRQEC